MSSQPPAIPPDDQCENLAAGVNEERCVDSRGDAEALCLDWSELFSRVGTDWDLDALAGWIDNDLANLERDLGHFASAKVSASRR
ncbi:MAG: hypothetical protein AAF539_02940 [Planctomycetota bacterium]